MNTRSVALVHDWLEAPGGGEAVLSELLRMYPNAEVFALVDFLTPAERAKLGIGRVTTSSLQRMPAARHWFRYAALLYPQIVERFDVSRHGLIISDSHAVAKGVRTSQHQIHVCYCYSPARFAWTMPSTYREGAGWLAPFVDRAQARFRAWDRGASEGVDHFVASSQHIAGAISTCYGRAADVIYPPVEAARFAAAGHGPRTDAYVTVSRLVPYKRIDLIIEAFRRMPTRRLIVVGDGPERRRIAQMVPGNVVLAGWLDDIECANVVGSAQAFVFAAVEDFGIAPLEAQAAGTPVIAYRGGAMSETIIGVDGSTPTGMLYDEQTPDALVQAVERFEALRPRIDPNACRANASRFTPDRFRAAFNARIAQILAPSRTGASSPSRVDA